MTWHLNRLYRSLEHSPIWNSRRALVAARTVGEMDLNTEERSQGIALLNTILQRGSASERPFREAGLCAFGLALIPIVLLPVWAYQDAVQHPSGSCMNPGPEGCAILMAFVCVVFLLPLLTAGLMLLISLVDRLHQVRIRQAVLCSLGRLGATESIPLLLPEARSFYPPTRREAILALQAIMPNLDAALYSSLPFGTAASLARHLNERDSELALAILDILERIGGKESLASIQRLIERGRTCEVRERAVEVWRSVNKRLQQKTDPHTLLRASQREIAPDQLLRPASSCASSQSAHLLRPTSLPEGQQPIS